MDKLSDMINRRLNSGIFTSDLTVDELVVLEDMDMQPLGLVLGSSIYHIGLQTTRLYQNQEMNVLTQAMYNARTLAIGRMEQEAHTLDADGIVGVRFAVNRYEWGEDLVEFMAIGTAVRARDEAKRLKPAHGRPFSSDLSAQDFWKLRQAGYRPLRFVMGNCVYHVAQQTLGQWFNQVGRNQEMTNFTQATYEARELAMSRMEHEAQEVGAKGIVAVNVKEQSWGWGSHIIEFFAAGTAVIPDEGAGRTPTPQMVLTLNNG